MANVAVEEITVRGVESDRAEELERQATKGLGEADLGPERPAVSADVDELGGVILANGRGDAETFAPMSRPCW